MMIVALNSATKNVPVVLATARNDNKAEHDEIFIKLSVLPPGGNKKINR